MGLTPEQLALVESTMRDESKSPANRAAAEALLFWHNVEEGLRPVVNPAESAVPSAAPEQLARQRHRERFAEMAAVPPIPASPGSSMFEQQFRPPSAPAATPMSTAGELGAAGVPNDPRLAPPPPPPGPPPQPMLIPTGRSWSVDMPGKRPDWMPGAEAVGAAAEGEKAAMAREGEATAAAAEQVATGQEGIAAVAGDDVAQAQAEAEAQKQRQAEAEKRVVGLEAESRRLATEEPDLDRYWNRKSFGQKLLAVLASTIAGAGAALTGQKNPVLEAIDRMIDEDIRAQEKALSSKKAANSDERVAAQRLADKAEALGMRAGDLYRQATYQRATAMLEAMKTRATGTERQAVINRMIAGVESKRLDTLRQWGMQEVEAGRVRKSGSVQYQVVMPQAGPGAEMPFPRTEAEVEPWLRRKMEQATASGDPKAIKAAADMGKSVSELFTGEGGPQTRIAKASLVAIQNLRKKLKETGGGTKLLAALGWRTGDASLLQGYENMVTMYVNRATAGGNASEIDRDKVERMVRPGWIYSTSDEGLAELERIVRISVGKAVLADAPTGAGTPNRQAPVRVK